MLSLTFYLLSLFTVFDSVLEAIAKPAVGEEALLCALIHRCRRVLYLIVPLGFWHVYMKQASLTSWSLSINAFIGISLEYLKQQDVVRGHLRLFSPVTFSLVYSFPIHVAYIFYFIAIFKSTTVVHAFLQTLFLLKLEIIDMIIVLRRMMEIYRTNREEEAEANRMTSEAHTV